MDHTKAINRYRNLLVVCILLILALSLALFESKSEQATSEHQHDDVSPTTPAKQTDSLFRVGDQRYSFEMLDHDFQSPLYQIRKLSFEQQMLVLEQAIVETYIANQILANGNKKAVMAELFPNLSVSEPEIVEYYQQNQNAQTPPFETLKPQLAEYLLALKRESSKKELLTRLLVSGKVQVLLESPSQPTPVQ
ncbi:MAG: hypothetical protein V7752_17665 [Halopseudomonas sp.]